jgi:hypothetical protein
VDLEARAWVSGLPGESSTRLQQSGGRAAGWLRAGPVGVVVVFLQGRTDRKGQTYVISLSARDYQKSRTRPITQRHNNSEVEVLNVVNYSFSL